MEELGNLLSTEEWLTSKEVKMRARLPLLLFVIALVASGCFTNFQTAKTVEGTSLTVGWQRIQREDHWADYYVFMPRFGRAARRNRFGYDIGIRAVLLHDPEKEKRSVEPTLLEDFKLQLPKNRIADLSIDTEFWGIFPMNLSVLLSKDLWGRVTPYCEFEAKGILLNLHWEEDWTIYMPSLIYGLELKLSRNSSIYIEGERWLREELEENLLFGVAFRRHISRKR